MLKCPASEAEQQYYSAVRNLSGAEIVAIESDPTVRAGDSSHLAYCKNLYAAMQREGHGVADVRRPELLAS